MSETATWRDVVEGRARWCVVEGDALAVLPQMPSRAFDAVTTDPPYGTGSWLRPESGAGGDPAAEHRLETWDVWRTDWLDDAWRVSRFAVGTFLAARETSSLLGWIGNRRWRLCVWVRSDPRPRFSGQPGYGFDPFVVVGKVQPCGGSDVVVASSPRQGRDRQATGHPHQKRVDVMAWAVDLCCPPEGLVLDPFGGSGTTAVSCLQTGRRCVLIESDPEYAALARKRLAAVDAACPLFDPARQGDLFDEGVTP